MNLSKKQISILYTSGGLFIIIAILILLTNDSQIKRPIFKLSTFNENFSEIQNFNLNLTVFMHNKTLRGQVTYMLDLKVRMMEGISLDMRNMDIFSVRINIDCKEEKPFPIKGFSVENVEFATKMGMGQQLVIHFQTHMTKEEKEQKTFCLYIDYMTNSSNDGLGNNWVPREQTISKLHPMFFTNCEPTHCRDFMPIQDSLNLNTTFTADIYVPYPLKAWMSAQKVDVSPIIEPNKTIDVNIIDTTPRKNITAVKTIEEFIDALDNMARRASNENPGESSRNYSNGLWRKFSFKQETFVTAFMISLLIADYEEFKYQNDNITIIGDKYFIEFLMPYQQKALHHLQYSKDIIGQNGEFNEEFTLVILPFSSPYKFSSAPNISYISASYFTNDANLERISYAYVRFILTHFLIVEEFGDWWLIEGTSVFIERAILSQAYNGTKDISIEIYHMYERLKFDMARLCENPDNCIVTALEPPLYGTPPEIYTSSLIPFEKGYLFMKYLESVINETKYKEGPTLFMEFIIGFISELKKDDTRTRTSLSSFRDSLVGFLKDQFKGENDKNIETRRKIEWIKWLKFKKDLPRAPPVSQRYKEIFFLARSHFLAVYKMSNDSTPNRTIGNIFDAFTINEKRVFISAYAIYDELKAYPMEYMYTYFVKHLQPVLNINSVIDIEFLTLWFAILVKYTDPNYLIDNKLLNSFFRLNAREDFISSFISQMVSSSYCKTGIYELGSKIYETNAQYLQPRSRIIFEKGLVAMKNPPQQSGTMRYKCSENGFPIFLS